MAKIIIEIEDTADRDFQVHLFTNTEQRVSDAILDLDVALSLPERTKAITIAAVGMAAIRKFVMESHEFSQGQSYGELRYGEDVVQIPTALPEEDSSVEDMKMYSQEVS